MEQFILRLTTFIFKRSKRNSELWQARVCNFVVKINLCTKLFNCIVRVVPTSPSLSFILKRNNDVYYLLWVPDFPIIRHFSKHYDHEQIEFPIFWALLQALWSRIYWVPNIWALWQVPRSRINWSQVYRLFVVLLQFFQNKVLRNHLHSYLKLVIPNVCFVHVAVDNHLRIRHFWLL